MHLLKSPAACLELAPSGSIVKLLCISFNKLIICQGFFIYMLFNLDLVVLYMAYLLCFISELPNYEEWKELFKYVDRVVAGVNKMTWILIFP